MPSFQTAQRSANEHDSIGNTFSKTTPACVCRARLVAPDVSAGTSAFVAALRRAVALARSRTRPVVSGGVARRFRSDRRLDLACASTLRVRTDRARRLSAAAHLRSCRAHRLAIVAPASAARGRAGHRGYRRHRACDRLRDIRRASYHLPQRWCSARSFPQPTRGGYRRLPKHCSPG